MSLPAMPTRPLSETAARACEEAREKVCRCRCGGALHGARRGDVTVLAEEDPHHAQHHWVEVPGSGTGVVASRTARVLWTWRERCASCGTERVGIYGRREAGAPIERWHEPMPANEGDSHG